MNEEREVTCVCCKQKFMSKIQRIQSAGIGFGYGFSKFCPDCEKKLEAVKWRSHHKKDPTPKDLQKALKKRIKELLEMLDVEPNIFVMEASNPDILTKRLKEWLKK